MPCLGHAAAAAACRGEVKLKLLREHGGSSEEHWAARGGKHGGDELTEYQLDGAIGPSSGNAEARSLFILAAAAAVNRVISSCFCHAMYATGGTAVVFVGTTSTAVQYEYV